MGSPCNAGSLLLLLLVQIAKQLSWMRLLGMALDAANGML